MHSIKHSSLYFVLSLILISDGEPQYFDTFALTLEGQDLNEYICTVNTSQIKKSFYLTQLCASAQFDQDIGKITFDPDAKYNPDGFYPNAGKLIDGVLTYSLPNDEDVEFSNSGFNDMCTYLQNDNFTQDYDEYHFSMPLLLAHSNDFYNIRQLSNQEVLFLKQIESYDDNNTNINMTRMNDLFKIAAFLEMERLSTIIAARHASLMRNMSKTKMIEWILDIHNNPNNKERTTNHNDNHGMVPLLSQTLSSKQCTDSQDNDKMNANKLNEYDYHWILLQQILSFFSCYQIHIFASISDKFYEFAKKTKEFESNIKIEPMIKVLTNNNEATCLSLTNHEVLFYKPFLILPQYKWNENLNNTYNQLKTMTNNTLIKLPFTVDTFYFDTLMSSGDGFDDMKYHFGQFRLTTRTNDSIEIGIHPGFKHFQLGSFKFGKFDQLANSFAQSRNIDHTRIQVDCCKSLKSLNNLIGINNIKNVQTIQIFKHSFPFINFQEIYNINNQLECLKISKTTTNITSVKNMKFLTKMKSLKELDLSENNLDSFDFDALEGLTNLQVIIVKNNKFNYKLDAQCLDLAFLNNVPNLKQLDLASNEIKCIINFESIQQHTQLEYLSLENNHLLSSIDFTKFDASKPLMNSLKGIHFSSMNLTYTRQNNHCLDLQFLKFMPNVEALYLSDNKIECIDNVSILQRKDIKLRYFNLDFNHLRSFDFSDLIGSSIVQIYLTNNNLSFESLKNFDFDTLSQINAAGDRVFLGIIKGNDIDVKFSTRTRAISIL